eukprot:gene19797-biopygen7008
MNAATARPGLVPKGASTGSPEVVQVLQQSEAGDSPVFVFLLLLLLLLLLLMLLLLLNAIAWDAPAAVPLKQDAARRRGRAVRTFGAWAAPGIPAIPAIPGGVLSLALAGWCSPGGSGMAQPPLWEELVLIFPKRRWDQAMMMTHHAHRPARAGGNSVADATKGMHHTAEQTTPVPPAFAPRCEPPRARAKWGPMSRMGSGSSLAVQRPSRDTAFSILSAWLPKRRFRESCVVIPGIPMAGGGGLLVPLLSSDSSPPVTRTRTRTPTHSVWCGNRAPEGRGDSLGGPAAPAIHQGSRPAGARPDTTTACAGCALLPLRRHNHEQTTKNW